LIIFLLNILAKLQENFESQCEKNKKSFLPSAVFLMEDAVSKVQNLLPQGLQRFFTKNAKMLFSIFIFVYFVIKKYF